MSKLQEKETEEIKGGLSLLGGFSLVGLGIFIIGILDGFTRPLACR